METGTLQAFLRILYTVNSNPQYILAKSSSPVPAIRCVETTTESAKHEPVYAQAPLRACLAVICDSSPELLQDPTRDFSLYVLDPLEAQPLPTSLAHSPHDNNSPRGVAVALGLMSWALESNDSMNVFVTGTITPHVLPALEVVFALRETKRIPKPIFHLYPSLSAISAPVSSQPPQPPHPPQVAGTNWSSTYPYQQQPTMTRSTDFPELYIGPPRRARGRPGRSTSSKAKATLQANGSSLLGASQSKAVETQSEPKQERERRSHKKTKSRPPRPPPTFSPFICAPMMRDTEAAGPEGSIAGIPAFYGQSHPFNQSQSLIEGHPQPQPYILPAHSPLLGLLSTVPSTSSGSTAPSTTPEQQAALLSALQKMLATNPHILQLAASNMGLSASSEEQATDKKAARRGSNTDDEHDDGDSDIVILDSSTIDAAAFRKQSTWQLTASDHDAFPLTLNQESPVPSSQGTDSSPLPASTPSVALESTPTAISDAETPTSKGRTERGNVTPSHALEMPTMPTPSRTRKRKLGEYIRGQAHLSTSMSPPSPSPSVPRSSGRALAARRVQSSPTGGTKSVIFPSARLPSMLGSMRTIATSGPRPQANSLGPSMHGHPVSLTPNTNGNQSMTSVSCPSKPKTEHHEISTASLNGIASATTSLKRRCTLSEFMAEHEARKNAKVRKRATSGQVELSGNASYVALPRPAKLSSIPRNAQSSPPRPLFRSDSATSSLHALVPGTAISNFAISSMAALACTVPSPSASRVASTKNPLKNFVLPAWARTSTATLPRLSEKALARQRAEQEAKKAHASLRRREAAKAKRKRIHAAEHPSKESSDEDEDAVAIDATLRTLNPSSSVTRSAPLPPPPLPSLPVFASDAVEPIPSSPPQSHRQRARAVVPSTPPRKPVSSGPALHRTLSKSSSCSLFTPSSHDPLFTPSTPSVTRSLTQVASTPRSPTVLRRSGPRPSPRKNVPQTPWTPKCNGSKHTPISLRTGRNPQLMSPSLAIRTPQAQMGMGTRAFLLPPHSPCMVQGGSSPIAAQDPGTIKQESPSDKQSVEPDEALLMKNTLFPPVQCSPGRSTTDAGQGTSDPRTVTSNDDASQGEEEYASSPLPPSSPLPASAFSSPTKHNDSDIDAPTKHNHVLPDSDVFLPFASGSSDGPQRAAADTTLLSDNGAYTASWITDSEASAWLTETEAWLTDVEGAPLLTDSDAAWLSDSAAVFGDMDMDMDVSSLPPSSALHWLSDDADVDTSDDGEIGGAGQDGKFKLDAAAFERAFAALVECTSGGRDADQDVAGTGAGMVESEHWTPTQLLRGGSVMKDAATHGESDVGNAVDGQEVAQDIRELLGGLVGT